MPYVTKYYIENLAPTNILNGKSLVKRLNFSIIMTHIRSIYRMVRLNRPFDAENLNNIPYIQSVTMFFDH